MVREAEFDPPTVEAEWLFSRSGAVAFDVGANMGRVASQLSSRFARVVAFEPSWECRDQLGAVAASHPNVVVVSSAASTHSGSVTLTEQSKHLQSGQLTTPYGDAGEFGADSSWGEIVGQRSVPAISLNDAVDQFGFPDFVKIDVEGHELAVVEGAMRVFEQSPAFYIEVHHAEIGAQIFDLISPFYQHIATVRHPGYAESDFGFENHYWLTAPVPG